MAQEQKQPKKSSENEDAGRGAPESRRSRAQGAARRGHRRDPRRDRRRARDQRRGLRQVVHPEGRPVSDVARPDCRRRTSRRAPRHSADFLSEQAPDLLPSRRTLPAGSAADLAPHGTTIVAATYPGGVVMAGDRRATMGNIIAQRDIEKVFPADEYSVRGHRRHRGHRRRWRTSCGRAEFNRSGHLHSPGRRDAEGFIFL